MLIETNFVNHKGCYIFNKQTARIPTKPAQDFTKHLPNNSRNSVFIESKTCAPISYASNEIKKAPTGARAGGVRILSNFLSDFRYFKMKKRIFQIHLNLPFVLPPLYWEAIESLRDIKNEAISEYEIEEKWLRS